jgi:hypothetical protein
MFYDLTVREADGDYVCHINYDTGSVSVRKR